jgi:hypothetical protein
VSVVYCDCEFCCSDTAAADHMAEAADPLSALASMPIPPRAGDDWKGLVETLGNLRYSEWPVDLERARLWYEPHLDRIHEDAETRRADLIQLEQIASRYPSREREISVVHDAVRRRLEAGNLCGSHRRVLSGREGPCDFGNSENEPTPIVIALSETGNSAPACLFFQTSPNEPDENCRCKKPQKSPSRTAKPCAARSSCLSIRASPAG